MDIKVKSYNHYKQESKYSLALIYTMLSMLVCVLFSISFIAIGATLAALIQLIGAFVFMIVSGLLRRRINILTRYISMTLSLILVFINSTFMFGPGYGFQYQLFPFLVVIFLLLDYNLKIERWNIYAISIITVTMFFIIQYVPFKPIFENYMMYESYYFAISLAFSFIGMLVLLFYLSREIFAVRDQLYSLATTDALTALYNRRTFIKRGQEAFKIAERGGNHFSIIIFDIDFFKSVNDEYGHVIGDVVLRSIAKHAKDSLRETDLLARYGGEEFAVLLQNTSQDQALVVAEKLRERIEAFEVDAQPHKINRTISLGVMGYHYSISSFDELIDKADKAMYKSKMMGKNRITLYNMTDPFYRERRLNEHRNKTL
ncbi:diguanylate cyclase [Acidaminobacter sp. JC074]|uniref:GGDEF domain-containing protein n=1 Tax=Acidaminobacter sp. JC074 TaxID=2530199 RepID=UPI001F0FBD4E|nr:GGDEF domain-containing protein [Acidaminobacter sp. JC074]MCH4887621.1 diguanylate cyclase [Acidaminobacter sp. JC074]